MKTGQGDYRAARFVAVMDGLGAAGLKREVAPVEGGAAKWIVVRGKPALNAASNDYLGLSGEASVKAGAIRAVERYGAGVGASRLVSGNTALHDRLEAALADFFGTERALLFSSGYAANVGIFTALADRRTFVVSDKWNHASILDGAALSGATLVRHAHLDLAGARRAFSAKPAFDKRLLVADSIFSMDGDEADPAGLLRLAGETGALFVVDEAHATGVFGQGRGLCAERGVVPDIHMGTLSKALGALGGFVAGEAALIDCIVNRARPFIFSTALPPAAVGAALAALKVVRERPEMGRNLLDAAARIRDELTGLGFDVGASTSQIIPVILGANDRSLFAREALLERGVFCPAIRPPAVPTGTARLRLSLRADFDARDVDRILNAFNHLKKNLPA